MLIEKLDDRLIVCFDIDNTLYSVKVGVTQAIGKLARGPSAYSHSQSHKLRLSLLAEYLTVLGFDDVSASRLRAEYRSKYGLTVRGLVLHHKIGNFIPTIWAFFGLTCIHADALDYQAKCIDSLPLEGMLQSDLTLRKLLKDINRTKCQVWGLTNSFQPVCVTIF